MSGGHFSTNNRGHNVKYTEITKINTNRHDNSRSEGFVRNATFRHAILHVYNGTTFD
jgi:hypothetical protein